MTSMPPRGGVSGMPYWNEAPGQTLELLGALSDPDPKTDEWVGVKVNSKSSR